jgi:hypothetical protein
MCVIRIKLERQFQRVDRYSPIHPVRVGINIGLLSSNERMGGKRLIKDLSLVIRRIRGVCEWHDIVSFANHRSALEDYRERGWSKEERDRHAVPEGLGGIEGQIPWRLFRGLQVG